MTFSRLTSGLVYVTIHKRMQWNRSNVGSPIPCLEYMRYCHFGAPPCISVCQHALRMLSMTWASSRILACSSEAVNHWIVLKPLCMHLLPSHTFTHRFRLISRAMAAFLHCQMPVDSSQSTQLRVVPNAPGHVRDPTRNQPSPNLLTTIVPTKQGDQAFNCLESLLNNKHYAHLKEHISYSVSFVNNMNNNVMNSIQLLVHLCTSLYPDCRFLDVLRILQL